MIKMTTAITIDAHAGWDVEVVIQDLDSDGNLITEQIKVVPKHTKETVYIHSHRQIGSVKELKIGG